MSAAAGFPLLQIVEKGASAMGDGISHFIKCEMRGEYAESAKPIGIAFGRIVASHFFKKVRSGRGRKHTEWLSDSESRAGVRA